MTPRETYLFTSPRFEAKAASLNSLAFHVYFWLTKFAAREPKTCRLGAQNISLAVGDTYTSNKTLADLCHCNEKSIDRTKKTLKDLGLISVRKVPRKHNHITTVTEVADPAVEIQVGTGSSTGQSEMDTLEELTQPPRVHSGRDRRQRKQRDPSR